LKSGDQGPLAICFPTNRPTGDVDLKPLARAGRTKIVPRSAASDRSGSGAASTLPSWPKRPRAGRGHPTGEGLTEHVRRKIPAAAGRALGRNQWDGGHGVVLLLKRLGPPDLICFDWEMFLAEERSPRFRDTW
jgi:hypothetical protein